MKTRIVTYKPKQAIPPKIYKQLYRLNFGDGGWMRRWLYFRSSMGIIIRAILGPKDLVISWGQYSTNDFTGDRPTLKDIKACIGRYTRKKYRNQGYGRRLLNY